MCDDAGMDPRGSLSSDLVQLLLRAMTTGGEGLTRLLEQAGIDPGLLDISQQRIPAEQFHVFWMELERTSGDPNLGLRLGSLEHGLPAGHVLFSVMLNSPTVGEALQRYCRYHGLMADIVEPRLAVSQDGAVLGLGYAVELHRQHVELIFSLVVSVLRQLASGRFQGRITFRHPRPTDTSEHERLLGPDVDFARPEDQIILPRSFLDRPIPRADGELLPILEQYARRALERLDPGKTWTSEVARLLNRSLCEGKPGLDQVSRRLGMSRRSLQARLASEGTSYQDVLDGVRKEMACFYLRQSEMSLTEVAFLLGYSDQSAFTHSFRKWTGDSPGSYRKQRP